MPSINGGMKLVKYALFAFNFIFVVFGIVLIWKGVQVKYGFSDIFATLLNKGDDGGHSIPPTIFIAVGVFMFIIAFLGCCGAITENHCMMMLYSVLVGLILVIQLGGAIAAYAFQDDVERALSSGLEASRDMYYNTTMDEALHNETVRSWNLMQHDLKCCGVHNYTDWADAKGRPEMNYIPQSCCIDGAFDTCADGISKDTPIDQAAVKIYTEGCLPTGISKFAINHMGTLGIILAAVEALGVVCACLMARSIRFSYETV